MSIRIGGSLKEVNMNKSEKRIDLNSKQFVIVYITQIYTT